MDDEELTPAELVSVVEAVRAVVERDEAALRAIGAYEDTDTPLLWADEHVRTAGAGRLVMPPLPPEEWDVDLVRDGDWAGVDVQLWTEAGRSDLTLQLELRRQADGEIVCTYEDLHVL